MIKKIYLILLLTLGISMFYSCINMTDPVRQARYINCYNSFDKSLVDFIPKKIPNNYLNMGYSSLEFIDKKDDYAGIHITLKVSDKTEYLDLKEQYSKKAVTIKNSQDSCLFVVWTYGEFTEDFLKGDNCENPYPVPQYGICVANDSTHLWNREPNKEVIILDYGYNDILDRESSPSRKNTHNKFSKGYSKGLTLDDKSQLINYWLIVW